MPFLCWLFSYEKLSEIIYYFTSCHVIIWQKSRSSYSLASGHANSKSTSLFTQLLVKDLKICKIWLVAKQTAKKHHYLSSSWLNNWHHLAGSCANNKEGSLFTMGGQNSQNLTPCNSVELHKNSVKFRGVPWVAEFSTLRCSCWFLAPRSMNRAECQSALLLSVTWVDFLLEW